MADRVCVYAVVSGPRGPMRACGLAGERLRRVRAEGVDLVVGIVPRVPRPAPGALRRYDAAIRGLMESHRSVLPARYGTCAASVAALAASVHDRRDHIRRVLHLVRGRVQMTVRVFAEPGRRPAIGTEVDGIDPATRGRQYLHRRAAQMQIAEAEPLRAAVRQWIRAERIERTARPPLAGSMYHLIPRAAVPAYRRAVERAARAARITTIVSGPWPPYAFADDGRP